MGSIRGADLDQRRAALGHDLRHAERAADLYQLAARDDDLPAVRERSQREQHRGSVVVDGEGGLRAGQTGQQRLNVLVAGPAPAAAHIDLECGISRHDLCDRPDRSVAQGSTAQVRVDDDARAVHGPSEAQRATGLDQRAQRVQERVRVRVDGFGAQQARPGLFHYGAGAVYKQWPWVATGPILQFKLRYQPFDRWQVAKIRGAHGQVISG